MRERESEREREREEEMEDCVRWLFSELDNNNNNNRSPDKNDDWPPITKVFFAHKLSLPMERLQSTHFPGMKRPLNIFSHFGGIVPSQQAWLVNVWFRVPILTSTVFNYFRHSQNVQTV